MKKVVAPVPAAGVAGALAEVEEAAVAARAAEEVGSGEEARGGEMAPDAGVVADADEESSRSCSPAS